MSALKPEVSDFKMFQRPFRTLSDLQHKALLKHYKRLWVIFSLSIFRLEGSELIFITVSCKQMYQPCPFFCEALSVGAHVLFNTFKAVYSNAGLGIPPGLENLFPFITAALPSSFLFISYVPENTRVWFFDYCCGLIGLNWLFFLDFQTKICIFMCVLWFKQSL